MVVAMGHDGMLYSLPSRDLMRPRNAREEMRFSDRVTGDTSKYAQKKQTENKALHLLA